MWPPPRPLGLYPRGKSEADTVGPSHLGLWKCTVQFSSVQWARFERENTNIKNDINTASTKKKAPRPPVRPRQMLGHVEADDRGDVSAKKCRALTYYRSFFFFFHLDFLNIF